MTENRLHTTFLLVFIFAATGTLLSCGWSGDRANEIYLEETYADLRRTDHRDTPKKPPERKTRSEPGQNRLRNRISGRPLTLKDCLLRALHHSRELRIQAEQVYEQELTKRKTIAEILPTVQAHGSFEEDEAEIQFGGSSFRPKNRTEYWFTASQPIIDGEFFPALESAEKTRKISQLRFKKKRNELLFQVASEFYRILQLEADIKSLQTALKSSREFHSVTRARKQAGEASRDEVLLASSRVSNVRTELIQARRDRKNARARLEELLQMNPLPEKLKEDYEPKLQNSGRRHLVKKARSRNEDVQIAMEAIERANAELDRARSRYIPSVDLTYTQWTEIEGGFNEVNDWTLSIDALWTLYDGGGREAEVATQHSRIRQNRLRAKRTRERVSREIREALNEYESLNKSISHLRNRADASAEAARIVADRYSAGSATNLDVLRAQETAEEAERNLKRGQYARKLAALRIHLSAGTMETAKLVQNILK